MSADLSEPVNGNKTLSVLKSPRIKNGRHKTKNYIAKEIQDKISKKTALYGLITGQITERGHHGGG